MPINSFLEACFPIKSCYPYTSSLSIFVSTNGATIAAFLSAFATVVLVILTYLQNKRQDKNWKQQSEFNQAALKHNETQTKLQLLERRLKFFDAVKQLHTFFFFYEYKQELPDDYYIYCLAEKDKRITEEEYEAGKENYELEKAKHKQYLETKEGTERNIHKAYSEIKSLTPFLFKMLENEIPKLMESFLEYGKLMILLDCSYQDMYSALGVNNKSKIDEAKRNIRTDRFELVDASTKFSTAIEDIINTILKETRIG